MKNKSEFFFGIIFLWMLCISFDIHAQKLSKEKSLFYLIKIWNWTSDNFIDKYGLNCDSYNYSKNNSDEFMRAKYRNNIKNIINDGVNKINFNEKFTLVGNAEIGEYNFDGNYFPIISWNWVDGWWFKNEGDISNGYEFNIKYTININEYNAIVKMNADEANNFIQSRKSTEGKINRRVYLKATYSILDKVVPTSNNVLTYKTYFYSIDIYGDEGLTRKLSTIYPPTEYYDKVHGIKIKDGEQIICYDKDWNIIKDKIGASYYRVINYADGKISGTVKDYFISGQLQMEGTYGLYYAENGFGNGLFTWYYENGQKSQEENYTNGKLNGSHKSWYSNGQKKEDVNYSDGKMNDAYESWHSNGGKKEEVIYINGSKDGCDYTWDEDGNCQPESNFKYADFYKAGHRISYSRDCPCAGHSPKKGK